MVPTSNGSNDVHENTGQSPEKTRDFESPVSQNLSTETQGVVVWDVICNDRDCKDDETEFSECLHMQKATAQSIELLSENTG
jgi:hypothetical protein